MVTTNPLRPSVKTTSTMSDDDSDEDEEDEKDIGESTDATPSPRRKSGYERGEIIEVTVTDVSDTAVTVDLTSAARASRGLSPAENSSAWATI